MVIRGRASSGEQLPLAGQRLAFPDGARRTLKHDLQVRGQLPARECIELGIAITVSLETLHSQGMVHGHITTSNIVISDGRPTLSENHLNETESYAPPEGTGTPHADLYSLAKVLLECFTGNIRFHPEQVPLASPSALNDTASCNFQALLRNALAASPIHRYQTARSLLCDLQRVQHGEHPLGTRETYPLGATAKITALLTVLGLLMAIVWYNTREPTANPTSLLPAAANKLVAIEPFEIVSDEPTQREIARRLQKEFVQRFAELIPPAAIPKTAEKLAKTSDSLRGSQKLGFTTLLSGAIRFETNQVLLSAQLRKVSNGETLWEGTHQSAATSADYAWTNLLRDVVASAMQTLRPREQRKLTAAFTPRFEAVEHHLAARRFTETPSLENSSLALDELGQAIDLFPAYKEAYISLASLHRQTADRYKPPREAMSQCLHALERALTLDTNFAASHGELAIATLLYDWNWRTAEAEFETALSLDPNNDEYHAWYARLLQCKSQLAEARPHSEKALELAPSSLLAISTFAQQLILEGTSSQGIGMLNRYLDKNPDSVPALVQLASALGRTGNHTEALAVASKIKPESNSPESLAWSGVALAKLGRTAEAEESLRQIKLLSRRVYVSPMYPAMICTALGRKREALMHLGNAYTYRSAFMTGLKIDYPWAELQSEPRFLELLRRVGLERRAERPMGTP